MRELLADPAARKRLSKSWSFAFDVVLVDQLTKFFLMPFVLPLWQADFSYFSIRLLGAINHGFAFSIPAPYALILVFVLSVLGAVIYWWFQELRANSNGALALSLVIGGAVSNLIDRIRLGGVYDWIEIAIRGLPVSHFNLADVAIVVGVFAYLALQKRTETV